MQSICVVGFLSGLTTKNKNLLCPVFKTLCSESSQNNLLMRSVTFEEQIIIYLGNLHQRYLLGPKYYKCMSTRWLPKLGPNQI